MVTVFTPTYNRAYIIGNLYQSLLRQSCKEFEWLIVDDGSTDNTTEVVEGFTNDDRINIRYIKQENGGKHRAVNRGVREAAGDLFFIVDSDDYLTDDSIEIILSRYPEFKDREDIAGMAGLRYYGNGTVIGTPLPYDRKMCNVFEYRYKDGIKGDKAEIVKTEVFKKFPFPEIEGEKFIAESVVWNRIGVSYKWLFTNDKLYICDYLEDGLTASSVGIRLRNPKGACLLYKELAGYPLPVKVRVKAAVNYWRFSLHDGRKFSDAMNEFGRPFLSAMVYPLAYRSYRKDIGNGKA